MLPKLVIGNWKLNGSLAALRGFAESLADEPVLRRGRLLRCEAALCVPYPLLPAAQALLAPYAMRWGAQDCSAHAEGAYTGEVSATMVAEFGARYVIIGHSERRLGHGETDELVVDKVRRVLAAGLVPIVCIGETAAERDANETAPVLRRQLQALTKALPRQLASIVFAYEPVWAIGQGDAATPGVIADMHAFIARTLHFQAGLHESAARILYGGSVKPDNAAELLALPDVDGALVGGASLEPESFAQIVAAAA